MKKNENSQNKLKIKHSSVAGCYWLLLHVLIYQPSVMSLPPGPASSCKRALHKRARSQTLKDIGRLCCARQPPPPTPLPPSHKPGLVWLLAPSPWFWWMPDELKRARRVQSTHCSIAPASVPSPCLPWHFLNLMEKKNEPITNQVKCQTAYLSILMSNNDQVAANQPMSAVPMSCWEGGPDVCCLLSTYTRTAQIKSGERIPKPIDPAANTEQLIFESPRSWKYKRSAQSSHRGTKSPQIIRRVRMSEGWSWGVR